MARSSPPMPDNQDTQTKGKHQSVALQVMGTRVKILSCDELSFICHCHSSINQGLFRNECRQRLLKLHLGKEGGWPRVLTVGCVSGEKQQEK